MRLKLISSLFCVGILFVLSAASSASTSTVLFQDGFENISVGQYPSLNGWIEAESLNMEVFVSDQRAYSGEKSFCFHSNVYSGEDALSVDYVSLADLSSKEINFNWSTAILSTSQESSVSLGLLRTHGGFNYKEIEYIEQLNFKEDGVIELFWGITESLNAQELGTWEPDRWYEVEVTTSIAEGGNICHVFINGEEKAAFHPPSRRRYSSYFFLGGLARGQQEKGYIYADDVKLCRAQKDGPKIIEYEVVDLFNDTDLEDLIRYSVLGFHVYFHVSTTVSQPDKVDSVEVEVTGTVPSRFELIQTDDDHYERTLYFLTIDKPLQYLLPFLAPGTTALPPSDSSQVAVESFRISDQSGDTRSVSVNIPVANFVDHFFNLSFPTGTEQVTTFAAYSPVDICVTSIADGRRTGML